MKKCAHTFFFQRKSIVCLHRANVEIDIMCLSSFSDSDWSVLFTYLSGQEFEAQPIIMITFYLHTKVNKTITN